MGRKFLRGRYLREPKEFYYEHLSSNVWTRTFRKERNPRLTIIKVDEREAQYSTATCGAIESCTAVAGTIRRKRTSERYKTIDKATFHGSRHIKNQVSGPVTSIPFNKR